MSISGISTFTGILIFNDIKFVLGINKFVLKKIAILSLKIL